MVTTKGRYQQERGSSASSFQVESLMMLCSPVLRCVDHREMKNLAKLENWRMKSAD
jgi:hypothetical protein